ncbi:MAG: PASTA domain-containing protein [Clostridia bacterium]|nr:PASTA domain-containing protein [Clostridia bacterium]NCC75070.1 PASTA domain-containing protein [Clostridia bacterium]
MSRTRPTTKDRSRFRKPSRFGLVLFSLLLIGFASYLIYQLYQIQIVNYAVNAEQAAGQHYKKVAEMPDRGLVYDRNGIELAGTTYVYQIGITPKDVRSISENLSREAIGAQIAQILELPEDQVLAAFEKKDSAYVQLKKDVAREPAEALIAYLSEHDVGGFAIDSEPRRYYTNGDLASQVLGYTRYDLGNLVGQLGLEMQYNDILTGSPGYTYVETDNYQNKGELPFSVPTSLRARDGLNLNLSLDINIQRIVQEILAEAILSNDITNGGSAIIMDPYTGGVLAMASYPFFSSQDPTARPVTREPATWDGSSQENINYLSSTVWRNRAISDAYEPGSTFKSLTTAMAFDENVTRESEIYNDSPMYVLGQEIHCYTIVGHGMETLQEGFWHSCNPVFAQMSQKLGVTRFYQYIRAFGFRDVTGIDLPAEATGLIHTDPTELDMATLSYGESATVTPIQLANAYSAIANGGNLLRPRLVASITDSTGAVVREYAPETIRKVISEQTSTRLRELLKGVVLHGTGSKAYVEGYLIGGKTSTSTDEQGKHTLSFAGIAPIDSPQIVALIVLDKPADDKLTSSVASKALGEIVSQTLEYLGEARNYSEQDISRLTKLRDVPDLTGMTLAQARKELGTVGLNLEAAESGMGEQSIIRSQSPAPQDKLHSRGMVVVYPDPGPHEDWVVVPDFSKKTVSEAISAAAANGLNIRIEGDGLGLAVRQDPAPTHGEKSSVTNTTADPAPKETSAGETAAAEETETTTVTPETRMTNDEGLLLRGSIVRIWFEAAEEIATPLATVESGAANP